MLVPRREASPPAWRVSASTTRGPVCRFSPLRVNELGRKLTPMQRLASVEDIAEVVMFLAAGRHFMTGQNLVIDGGRVIHH